MLPFVLTAVFFLAILVIAHWGMRRTANVQDFFLGGKALGPWVLAFSYGTAYFSAVIFVGFAGQFGWQFGLNAIWIGITNAIIGAGLAWMLLGKRTRTMTHNLNARTMPEFFAARFETNGMKIFSALIIFVFLVPYSASVFTGLSYLFEIVFDRRVSFPTVLTTLSVLAFIYVAGGGYKAVARIDFLLGLVMFFGSLLMLHSLVTKCGGVDETVRQISIGFSAAQSPANAASPAALSVTPVPWFVLPSLIIMTSFGVWGLPQMVHKYYAIRDENEIGRGAIISTVFAFVIGCAAYFTGAMVHVKGLVSPIPLSAKGGVDFDRLVPDLLHQNLSPTLMAIILLLVLSASLSTLSSLVLVSASAVTIDLYKGYLNPKASTRRELILMRVLCGVFIASSYYIALLQPTWISTLMAISWGAVAGAFLAPYLYGLFWKRTTKQGAYAGMISGLLISNGWYWYWVITNPAMARAHAPVAACLAMIIPLAIVPVVSLLTRPPKKATLARAFAAPGEANSTKRHKE